jgi:hypothetical protein
MTDVVQRLGNSVGNSHGALVLRFCPIIPAVIACTLQKMARVRLAGSGLASTC